MRTENRIFRACVMKKQLYYDFEVQINKIFIVLKGLKISKAVKIDYFPNGSINVHYDYDGISDTFFY